MNPLTDPQIRKLPKGEYTDSRTTGLRIRVTRKGSRSFYLLYYIDGKRRKYRIGSADIGIKVARQAAKKIKAKIALGQDPQAERMATREQARKARTGTLRAFLDKRYYPHAQQTQRAFRKNRGIMEGNFGWLMNRQLSSITWSEVDKWQTKKLASGLQPQTINRKMTALKAALNKAVEWGILESSPLAGKRRLKTQGRGVVRFLSPDERDRLMVVLDARDGVLPVLVHLLLGTGARPKEAFTLRWSAVDFDARQIHFLSAFTKTAQTRVIPMSDHLHGILMQWREDCDSEEWVFPAPFRDGHMVSVQHSWDAVKRDAELEKFRLYDCRHDFASQLVQRGVPLYTVSKLLGHSNPQMTTIYAHISDDSLADAVNLL